jgi:hypothetical protein
MRDVTTETRSLASRERISSPRRSRRPLEDGDLVDCPLGTEAAVEDCDPERERGNA